MDHSIDFEGKRRGLCTIHRRNTCPGFACTDFNNACQHCGCVARRHEELNGERNVIGETEGQIPEWIPNEVMTDPGNKCQLTHMFETFSALHKLQKEGSLCDITIKVDDTSVQAHKVVLASCSVYFKTMFSSGFQESHQSEVNINGKSEAFQILLDFAYSGQLDISMETAIDVFEMAHYLQFDNVVERCGSFLNAEFGNQRVDVRNSIKILSVADLYGLENLKKKCKENIAKNFKTSDYFLQHMTFELMEEILQRSDLTDEKEVFDTTLAWLQHDWENRKVHAPALLRRIHLGLLPLGHLSLTALKSPDLYAIPECKEMIENVLKLFDAHKPSDPPLYCTHPTIFGTRTTVSAFLQLNTLNGSNNHLYYDTKIGGWRLLTQFPPMPTKDFQHAMDSCITVQGKLFVAKGTVDFPQRLKWPQFISLNAATNRWYTLAPMAKRRANPILVELDARIYAIGGEDSDIKSCEVYSILENNWHSITPMLRECSGGPSSATAYNGVICVYAPDVLLSRQVDHHLQMYNPQLDSWSLLATFNHPNMSELQTGLLVHEGKCYRIVNAHCNCTVDGCRWHEMRVDELIIDVANKTAVVGERQDQAVIRNQFRRKAFRINQDIFVICGGKYHKTGIKIYNNQVDEIRLNAWREISKTTGACVAAFFTFDKAVWL